MSSPLILARLCHGIRWFLLLVSFPCLAAPPLTGVYEQLQKQLNIAPQASTSADKDRDDDLTSVLAPLVAELLPIAETQEQLTEIIDKLQDDIARFSGLDARAYKKRLVNFSLSRLESELNELSSQQLNRQEDIDRIERLLLRHARERNTIQVLLIEVAELSHKPQKKAYPDISASSGGKHDNLIRTLEVQAQLLPLSSKRYELELQLTQLQLDHIVQKKNILETLLEGRIQNAQNSKVSSPSLGDSFFDDPELVRLANTELELRSSLTKARKDLLTVQQLGFDLEFQMKGLGHVSEVYELLENQRECLMKLQPSHSGNTLIHQLKLKRTIVSERIRSLDLSVDTFNRRHQLEKLLNRLDRLVPLAVELWDLEKELMSHHKQVMTALEQRRMWMAVAPALTPSQFFSTLTNIREQVELLGLELDTDHFGRLYWFLLFCLVLALVLSRVAYIVQKRFLNARCKPGTLSGIELSKLVLLIIVGSTPIPLWLVFSGLALKETGGYTFAFGQVLQGTAWIAFGWSLVAAFGREAVQQQIGLRQEKYYHWYNQAKILGGMSMLGLLLGEFAECWYNNPYDDRIAQLVLLLSALVQAAIEWKLIRKTHSEVGYYSLRLLMTLIFPMTSLVTATLAMLGYNLAAWAIFSHKQVVMVTCGLIVLVYELSLYMLYARTRKITLAHALHERRQAAEGLAPEDALEFSRTHIRELQMQGKRLLQLVLLVVFLFAIAWPGQDFINLVEPLGKINVWPFNHLGGSLSIVLGSVARAAIILLLTLILSRNLTGLLRLSLPAKFLAQPAKAYTLSRFSIYILWVSSGLLILNTLGISWEKLQWLILAITVGIGFGLQEIVANFFSGLIILLERPFQVGDTVTVGKVEGEVKQIHIRATIIEDFDRKELIIPNKTLVTGEVTNWSLSSSVLRVVLWYGVAHGSDNDLVFQLLMQAADECQKVLKDPPVEVYFVEYTEDVERYELRVFVNHVNDRFPVKNQLNTRVKVLFAEQGITVAHAQHDVHLTMATLSGGQQLEERLAGEGASPERVVRTHSKPEVVGG